MILIRPAPQYLPFTGSPPVQLIPGVFAGVQLGQRIHSSGPASNVQHILRSELLTFTAFKFGILCVSTVCFEL